MRGLRLLFIIPYINAPCRPRRVRGAETAQERKIVAGLAQNCYSTDQNQRRRPKGSPAFNKRTDEYGGCLENRCRFLTETIALCCAEVGPFFPILVRFSADEFLKDGLDMEQAVEIAKLLDANGVDAIDISAGGLRSNAEDAFQDTAYPVIRVGDAIRADKIHAAIYTAYCAARSL